jgi:hypothetical protein
MIERKETGNCDILPTVYMMVHKEMRRNERLKLGVIVLNWNAAVLTMRCVASLQSWQRLLPLVYVVDNGSTEEGLHIVENTDVRVRLIRSPKNLGYAGGNNLGIREAIEGGCEYLLLLNSDASISEANIEMLLEKMQEDVDIGCIGPAIHEGDRVYLGGKDIGLHINTRNTKPGCKFEDTVIYVDYVPGMVFLARREVIRSIGYLDEQYFFSGEIADLCKRAKKKGYTCAIYPATRADHVLEKDNPLRSTLYQYYSLRNRFLYIRKHHPNLRWILELFWVLWGTQRYARAILMGLKKESMAYRMAIADQARGTFGDRNDLFSV